MARSTFAVEVLNVSPTSALAGETPYTRRFERQSDKIAGD
ncbi:hypothetical protein L917_04866 [Phytophthora nicotianae]|uniref:Uncharacterized protein n=1 Tax=Phytophthora nicotianae TaxID=4792 RepID=W2LMI6_PHYNI|nr:hypothetical protein L917_04866 [Phytophthora nicotianae]